MYQDVPQIEGTLNHESIDSKKYSSSKDVLQWLAIYSDTYNLAGKIDLYHKTKKSLMERKTKIKELHQWYIYQLIAQYLCMIEMWYEVEKLKLYSLEDNKVYDIPIPDEKLISEFITFLETYKSFHHGDKNFYQPKEKCMWCIYRELCDFYLANYDS